MNKNKNLIEQETNAKKGKHLTYGKRCKIETRLGDGYRNNIFFAFTLKKDNQSLFGDSFF